VFHSFANVWTIIASSDALARDKPLPLEIARERIVVFRDGGGTPHGLIDRCPHRGVKLSLGRIVDDCLECPFHGWRFAGDGSNKNVPWSPEAKRAGLGAIAVPVVERGGLLWLYTAPGDSAPSEPEVNEILLNPRVRVMSTVIEWRVHWTRAMENMLDWPHLPFVHRATIGRGMKIGPSSVMTVHTEDRSWGCNSSISIDGELQPGGLDYRFPNAMSLHIATKGRIFHLMSVCVPIDEERTRMVFITARDFLKSRIFDPVFSYSNRRVAGEDQAILESSSPQEVPPPVEERSVATDRLPLSFRKIYYDRLRGSQAGLGLVPGSRLAEEAEPAG